MQFLLLRAGSAEFLAAPPTALGADEVLWCDCLHHEARAWVAPVEALTGASIFEAHLLDAENQQHPSYFEATDRYEMIVFRGLAFDVARAGADTPIRMKTQPTVFFLLPGCLVTVRAADGRLVPAVRERLIAAARVRQRLPASPEDLMLRLLNAMVDHYLDLRQPMTEQLERWQRQLLDPRRAFRDWLLLLDARSELRKLEQLCEEQLDALQEWRDERLEHASPGDALGTLSTALQVRASDLVNHIDRVLNHARRLQASLESAVQLHFSSTAYRTNEMMRTLTTITAIFMPLTLITGIFGMNFEFIPGLHSRVGFWLAVVAMGSIALLLLGYFRARRYLGTTRLHPRARRNRNSAPQAHDSEPRRAQVSADSGSTGANGPHPGDPGAT